MERIFNDITAPFIGNAFISAIGIAFTLGAPVSVLNKRPRFFWCIFWCSLCALYLTAFVISSIYRADQISTMAFLIRIIFTDCSTIALAVAYFSYYRQKTVPEKKTLLWWSLLFLIIWPVEALTQNVFLSQTLAWLIFMLIAWSWRIKNIASALILVGYANLQLPMILIGREGIGNDFLLLLASKLSLIGAMYYILGVNSKTEELAPVI